MKQKGKNTNEKLHNDVKQRASPKYFLFFSVIHPPPQLFVWIGPRNKCAFIAREANKKGSKLCPNNKSFGP